MHIDPPGTDTGSVTVAVNPVAADLSIPVTADGTATTATTSRGQVADFTFTGSAGQKVFVNTSNGSYPNCFTINLLRNPAGTQLNYVWYCGGANFIDTTTLPAAGTYSVHIDPPGTDTGSVTVAIKPVAADLSVPVTADGTATTATTSLGQVADLTFTGSAGQKVSVSLSGGSYPRCFSILLRNPAGGQLNYVWYCGGGASISTTTLASAGTYSVHIDPPGTDTGSVTVAVNTVNTVAGGAAISAGTVPAAPGGASDAATADELRPVHAVRPRSAAKANPAVKSQPTPAVSVATADELRPVRAVRPRPAVKFHPAPAAQPTAAVPAWVTTTPSSRDAWLPSRSNLAGVDWLSHRTPAAAASLPPLTAAPGVTALAGQVLTVGGTPLPGVTLSADGQSTRSDRSGRFLLTGISAGQRVLLIDGGSASTPSRRFGIFQVSVHTVAGRTVPLGYTIWLTKLDMAHASAIPSPTTRQTVLTTPEIPGFEVILPAGTVVRDLKGQVVRQLSITPVPTDRPPFPLPPGVVTPAYFTVQPGGSYIFPQGAQIIYPNSLHGNPGSRVQFYNYDPSGRGWYVYGGGSVTPDGKQVVPDPGVRVWTFTGAMINQAGGGPPPPNKPHPRGPRRGDPIDPSSGLFTFDQTDLSESDILPLTLTRSYRQADGNNYAFGPGFNWTYGIWQWSAQEYQQSDLVFPDGSRIHFVRISPGTSWADAVFRATDGWGDFANAIEKWNGNGWDVTSHTGLTYVFGDHQALQSIRDRYGNQLTLSRSSGGQSGDITQVTSPHGMWIRLSYNSAHKVTQAIDNSGHTVTYGYDGNGRLSQVTSATGAVTQYTWGSNNNLLTIVDARGHTVASNTYDSNNRVVDQQLGGGGHYLFSYQTDSNDNVTRCDVTDPVGNVTRYSFDAAGGTTSLVLAPGTSDATTWTYTRAAVTDYLTEVVDPLGHHTTFSYDSNGNVTQKTVLAGTPSARTTTVDTSGPYGQPVSVTDPLGHRTNFSYDALGNLTSVTDPASHVESYTYAPDGQLASVADTTSHTTTYTYNPLGQWAAATDPLGRVTRYFNDAADRPVMVANADGAATFQTYDASNHVTVITAADGGQTSLSYDADGELTAVTDAAGHTTNYSYDVDGNPTGWTQGTGGPSLTRTYDVAGRLVSSIDGRGTKTTVSYDPLGRASTVRYGVTGSSATSTIAYGYDAANRPTSIADSVDGTTNVVYDDFGEPTSVNGPHGTISYSYDGGGRLTGETVAGGTPISYGYTVASQLASVSQGSSSASYSYDSDGRLTSAALPGATQTYSYDAADQLSSISYASGSTQLGSLSYTYDPAGRVVGESGSWARLPLPAAMTASYNALNQATTVNGASRTYDDAGNLTSDGSNTYSWNERGQLASVTGPSGTESYGYAPDGLRDQVTSGGSSTAYLWDLTGNQVAELSGGSVIAHEMTAGLDNALVRTDNAGSHTQLSDQLGSVIATVDPTGTIETQNAYSPFGQQASSGSTNADAPGFTGRTTSSVTGLQYNRDRYYDPTLGRFISQDPTGQLGGINTYAYVGGDPLNATDPSGDGPPGGGNGGPPRPTPHPHRPPPRPKPPAPGPPPKPKSPTPGPTPKPTPDPHDCGPLGCPLCPGILSCAGYGWTAGALAEAGGVPDGARWGLFLGAAYGAGVEVGGLLAPLVQNGPGGGEPSLLSPPMGPMSP
ncbi:MAG TPA: RHS repeat-associated core domain-containing protein [Pseudonocardia sp.]|nr:RHS repeat-associated core domain-containing protein [Pseudonocardia sp.]